MEKITKEYTVYKYDELSEEAKEKVRNYFGQSDVDISFQTDILNEDFNYQIEEKYPYFVDAKFSWSLACCQGDGLSFSCDIDLGKYLDIHYPNMKTSVYDALCNAVYNLHSEGNKGHYCYARKDQIEYDYNYSSREFPKLYAILEKIVDEIREEYITICKEFEKQGYSAYEYLYSDEYAKNTCESNEHRFFENGKFFNE